MRFFRRKPAAHNSPMRQTASGPAANPPADQNLGHDVEAQGAAAEFLTRVERAVPDLLSQVDAETERLRPEIERQAARLAAEAAAAAEVDAFALDQSDGYAQPREPEPVANPGRREYVPKEQEAAHLVRDGGGHPMLRLVHTGDRLAIWSPLDGGALLNPKGPGLRALGLATTYARGSSYHAEAYRAADLRCGRPVELRREPDNPYDRNAIALHAPGDHIPFGYVQKGRAPALAKRMDAGETLAAVSLRGPGSSRVDDTTVVLIGSAEDVRVMLSGPQAQRREAR